MLLILGYAKGSNAAFPIWLIICREVGYSDVNYTAYYINNFKICSIFTTVRTLGMLLRPGRFSLRFLGPDHQVYLRFPSPDHPGDDGPDVESDSHFEVVEAVNVDVVELVLYAHGVDGQLLHVVVVRGRLASSVLEPGRGHVRAPYG